VFVEFDIKLCIYCITVSKHTKDEYYYVISPLLSVKFWKIVQAKILISYQVPSLGSQIRGREYSRNEQDKWCE